MGGGASTEFSPEAYEYYMLHQEYPPTDHAMIGGVHIPLSSSPHSLRYSDKDIQELQRIYNVDTDHNPNLSRIRPARDEDEDDEEEAQQQMMMIWLMELGFSKVRACELSFQFYDHGIISCQHLACEYASDRKLLDDFVQRNLMSPMEANTIISSSLFVVANSLRGNDDMVQSVLSDMLTNHERHQQQLSRQTRALEEMMSNDPYSYYQRSQERDRDIIRSYEGNNSRWRHNAEETQQEMLSILDTALNTVNSSSPSNGRNSDRRQLIHNSELFGESDTFGAINSVNRNIQRQQYNQPINSDTNQPHIVIKEWNREYVSNCIQLSHNGSIASFVHPSSGGSSTGSASSKLSGLVATDLSRSAVMTTTTIEVITLPTSLSPSATNSTILSMGVACKADYQYIHNSSVIPALGRTLGSCGVIFTIANSGTITSPSFQCPTIIGNVIENNLIIEQFGSLLEGDILSLTIDMDFEIVQIFLNNRLIWTFTSVLALVNLDSSAMTSTATADNAVMQSIVGVTMSEGCSIRLSPPENPVDTRTNAANSTNNVIAPEEHKDEMKFGEASNEDSDTSDNSVQYRAIQRARGHDPHQSVTGSTLRPQGDCPQPQLSAAAIRRMNQIREEHERQQASLRASLLNTIHHSLSTSALNSNASSTQHLASTSTRSTNRERDWYESHMEEANRLSSRNATAASSAVMSTLSILNHSQSGATNTSSIASTPVSVTQTTAAVTDDQSSALCCICLEHPKCIVLLPCRHMCLCDSCGDGAEHKLKQCPMCRQDITMTFKVFI